MDALAHDENENRVSPTERELKDMQKDNISSPGARFLRSSLVISIEPFALFPRFLEFSLHRTHPILVHIVPPTMNLACLALPLVLWNPAMRSPCSSNFSSGLSPSETGLFELGGITQEDVR